MRRFAIRAAFTTAGRGIRRLRAFCIIPALLAVVAAQAAEPLSATIIHNSTVYAAGDFFDVYGEYLGQPIGDDTAKAIAESVRQRYLADGFSRPGYRIADDGRQSGIIRIELVEASISGVRVAGDSGPHRERLQAMFAELRSDRSLRPDDLREILRQARRLPGLDVNVSTEPDALGEGGYVLQVDSDYRALTGSVTYTNRGTRQIGRDLVFARIAGNGWFGGDSVLGMFVASAGNHEDYASGGISLRVPLNENGASAQLQGSLANVQVVSSGVLVDQDRERFLLQWSRPLPDWGRRRVSAVATFEADNLDVDFDGNPARSDRLRSIEAEVSLAGRTGARQHLLTAEAEFGLELFGAGLRNFNDPDDGRRGDYAILRLHYVDLTALAERWTLRFDAYAQHSPHRLPSIRQFKVGGGRIGRGFDAAALSGDRGLGMKGEIRKRLAVDLGWLSRLDAYAFYDIGAAWDRNDRESAASTGLGLSWRGDRFSGYLEAAQPLTRPDADGNSNPGLFVELTGRF